MMYIIIIQTYYSIIRGFSFQSWCFSAGSKSETCLSSLDSTGVKEAAHLSNFKTKDCESQCCDVWKGSKTKTPSNNFQYNYLKKL